MNREIYILKVFSTRMEYDSFELELTPKENEEANDYYGMNFNVTVWCRGQMCAKLYGKLYDENLVYATGMDILNVADPVGKEEVALAEAFNGCRELCSKTEEWQNIQGFSGYVQGLFVIPPFRRRGIGSYLLTHLERILYHAMNIRIRAVGISPMPTAEPDGGEVEDMDLLRQNRKLLEKCGWHEILDLSLQGMMYGNYEEEDASGTGYYVRVFRPV